MLPAQPTVVKRSRSIRPLLFTLLVLCLLILANYVGRLRSLSQLDQQIASAQVSVEQATARQQMLLDQRARQQDSSTDTVDQAARRDLDMLKPGDYAYTVLEAATPAAEVVSEEQPDSKSLRLTPIKPIWKQWFDLLVPG
ncbi:MAG: septum formation initiator family protein [Caldilineaceae bacterium]